MACVEGHTQTKDLELVHQISMLDHLGKQIICISLIFSHEIFMVLVVYWHLHVIIWFFIDDCSIIIALLEADEKSYLFAIVLTIVQLVFVDTQ
jgi:hypothetical protein